MTNAEGIRLYVRRAQPVSAIQYDGSAESAQACGLVQPYATCAGMRGIFTQGGFHMVVPGEWVVDGREVMSDAEFHRDYEEVSPCAS